MHITRKFRRWHNSDFPMEPQSYPEACCYLINLYDIQSYSTHSPPHCHHLNFTIDTRIKADFNFFNVPYIRGFTSAFNLIDAKSSYQYDPSIRSKHPPVSLIKYIVGVFRSASYTYAIICPDKG